LESIGVVEGDKVLVPTWTFTASAEVIRYLGADPVFLDVDYGTAALTSAIIKKGILEHPDAKAIIIVHFGGQAIQMGSGGPDDILTLCRKNEIRIIEDAAHAFPAKDNDLMIGSIGDVTCFSFYANKTITTGEGGMLTTNDDLIADRVRLMRLHGIDRDVWDRFTSEKPSWEYDVIAPGFKYNMPDINAAIGLAQLERVFTMRDERQRCAEYYVSNLSDMESIDLPLFREPYEDHAWHLFPIILNEHATVARNRLIELLAEDGIGTSVHYKPLHRMSYYKTKYSLQKDDYPNAERLWQGCLSLPIYPSLTDSELAYICERLAFHLGN
jgi:dTDP-4-amino-4,6-dideoxygalactose transaminase